jgi:hypothetical protein
MADLGTQLSRAVILETAFGLPELGFQPPE